MYALSSRTVSVLTRVLYLCLFPSLLGNLGNKHKNIPLVSAETVRHSSTYTILFKFKDCYTTTLISQKWLFRWPFIGIRNERNVLAVSDQDLRCAGAPWQSDLPGSQAYHGISWKLNLNQKCIYIYSTKLVDNENDFLESMFFHEIQQQMIVRKVCKVRIIHAHKQINIVMDIWHVNWR